MAGTMSAELEALLKSNKVPQHVSDDMAKLGCNTMKIFANGVDARAEIQKELLDHTSAKDSKSALAGLKQAWREADALVDRGIKRGSEGLADMNADDPLPDTLQKSRETAWLTKYLFDLEPRFLGSDSLLGRFKREADKASPTMFCASRVRSLAHATRVGDPKRHKVGDAVLVQFADDPAILDDTMPNSLRTRLYQYTVMANTWALAGMHEVDVAGEKFIYCSLPEATKYVQTLRDKCEHLVDRYTEESVIWYLTKTEEDVRAKAIETVRSKAGKNVWGTALLTAMHEFSYFWQDNKESLVLRRFQAGGPGSPPARDTRRGGGGGNGGASPGGPRIKPYSPRGGKAALGASPKGSGKAAVKAPGLRTAHAFLTAKFSGQKQLCKRHNDPRGCKDPCPSGDSHQCDALLASDKACGSRSHKRFEHDEVKDGKCKTKP